MHFSCAGVATCGRVDVETNVLTRKFDISDPGREWAERRSSYGDGEPLGRSGAVRHRSSVEPYGDNVDHPTEVEHDVRIVSVTCG